MGVFSNTFSIVGQGVHVNSFKKLIEDGDTVAWYDSQALSTITKDGSNAISRWNDKLGSTHNLIQDTALKQPIWSSDGIIGDGTKNLKTVAFTYIQPEEIWMVFKILSFSSGKVISDGNATNSGKISQDNLALGGITITIYIGGAAVAVGTFVQVGKWAVMRALINGGASELQINTLSYTAANIGTANMGGITIMATGGGGTMSNMQIKEAIYRKSASSEINKSIIYNHLCDNYFKMIGIVGDSTSGVYSATLYPIAHFMLYDKGITDISYAGDTIAQQKAKWIISGNKNMKVVFVMVGLNNVLTMTSSQIIAAYQDLVNTIRTTIGGGKIIIATMIPCNRSSDQQWIDLNEAILGNGSTPITGSDGIINTVTTALNNRYNTLSSTYAFTDYLHENNLGRQLIADLYDAKLIELGF